MNWAANKYCLVVRRGSPASQGLSPMFTEGPRPGSLTRLPFLQVLLGDSSQFPFSQSPGVFPESQLGRMGGSQGFLGASPSPSIMILALQEHSDFSFLSSKRCLWWLAWRGPGHLAVPWLPSAKCASPQRLYCQGTYSTELHNVFIGERWSIHCPLVITVEGVRPWSIVILDQTRKQQ